MKKLKTLLLIIFLMFFSNVALADMMVPGQNCHSYDETCYNKCISNIKDDKGSDISGSCKEKCCTKEIKWCTNDNCKCVKDGNTWAVCKVYPECRRDCTSGGGPRHHTYISGPANLVVASDLVEDKENIPYKKIFIVLIISFLLITGIYIYKRKKGKS